jgi:hypothetical protein
MANSNFLKWAALSSIWFCTALQAQDSNRPVEFQRQIDGWKILGDFEIGTCIAMMQASGNTSLNIASMPNRSTLIFSIQNERWVSLGNEEDIRVSAIFRSKGQITDGWSLDSISMNANGTKPGFRFDIDVAKNDSASFPDQFSKSDTLEFVKDKIPLASFTLKGSRQALAYLYQCRDLLRENPNFDPFEK